MKSGSRANIAKSWRQNEGGEAVPLATLARFMQAIPGTQKAGHG